MGRWKNHHSKWILPVAETSLPSIFSNFCQIQLQMREHRADLKMTKHNDSGTHYYTRCTRRTIVAVRVLTCSVYHVPGRTFAAHKVILAAHSPYLENIFINNGNRKINLRGVSSLGLQVSCLCLHVQKSFLMSTAQKGVSFSQHSLSFRQFWMPPTRQCFTFQRMMSAKYSKLLKFCRLMRQVYM